MDILNEADIKLDGVRQKIGQIAEELRGEDIYQFHRAFTPGEWSFTSFRLYIKHIFILKETEFFESGVFSL